jgi:hypothetical protein
VLALGELRRRSELARLPDGEYALQERP